MRICSPLLFIRLILIFLEIQFSYQQQKNCDSSCQTCSTNKISECTSCQQSYFFFNLENKCVQNCPSGTYLDYESKKCVNCASSNCNQCSQSTCFQCISGFQIDPNNPNNCISDCSLTGQILNEQGQCDLSCLSDDSYEVNSSINSCEMTKPCSLLKKTPELQNKSDIVSQLYDELQKSLISIDVQGNIVIYGYPELNVLVGYTLKIPSSTIINCSFADDNDLSKQIISCLLSPLGLIKFYSSDGTVISQSQINDRIFTKSLDSGRDWNLILALKDRYEIYLINYKTEAYIYAENIYQAQIQAMTVKQSVYSFPYDTIALNYTDGTINYFQVFQPYYNKILSFSAGTLNRNSKLIQLKSQDYWILYTNTEFNLLKLNTETFQMTLKQTQTVKENISSVYLTSVQSELLFIVGKSTSYSLQFKLFELDYQTENLIQKEQEIFNSQLSNVNQINVFSNTIITCSAKSIDIYQLSYDNSLLKYLTHLREDNPQICLISKFSVMRQDTSVHIWQQVQKNLKINTFDTKTQKYFQSSVANFAETDYSLKKFTNRDNFFNLLVESYENQQLFEIKTYGVVFIYDIIKKSILNQVRVWYPEHEAIQTILFNFVQMKDNVYLFAGFERQTFKVKIINIKTFEISYQQDIPGVNFDDFSDLRAVYSPIYFNNSDSMIVPIQRLQFSGDLQKKYDFIFIQKNQNGNQQVRYTLVSQIQQQGRNFISSNNPETLIVFVLLDSSTLTYCTTLFNKDGQKIYTTISYILKSTYTFGQYNEVTKKLYITSISAIYILNLDVLSFYTLSYKCLQTMSFNKAFNLLYVQDYCTPSYEGMYSYNESPFLRKLATVRGTFSLNYIWINNDQLILNTLNTNLVYYDNSNGNFLNLVSIHGINNGGFMQEKQIIFYNQYAISHYEPISQKLIFAEDSSIYQQFLLQTQKMRNNYIVSESLNIHQVKKYNQILLKKFNEPSSTVLFMQYVAELNYIISVTLTGVKIIDYNTVTMIKLVETDFLTKSNSYPNFYQQEVFQRKIHYYQPTNLLIAIYNSTLVCVNMTSLELAFKVQYQNEFQAFKSTLIDYELGYFISTNAVEDCFLNLKTLVRKCYKELDSYTLPSTSAIPFKTYTLELYIDQKTKSLIICQSTSIRMFSLLKFQYIKSYYNTTFGAFQFFYNPNYNYIIYTTIYQFRLFDLNTFTSSQLQSVPNPSKDAQTASYKTHALINTISLDTAPFAFSEWVVDQTNKFIFLIDQKNLLLQLSYEQNKVLSSYQLLSADATTIQKLMIWDSYKQKLIIARIAKNLIELYYADAYYQIVSIQLISNKNILFATSLLTGHLIDYDYLINDNKETFPNQINPRCFSVNENISFFINDVNSQINLFVNGKIKSTWIRNNLLVGYIRVMENDLKNNLVFSIFDNEITILDISSQEIVQIDQFYHDQNIINILYEDQFRVFLHSQSQQILTLQKKSNKIQMCEVIKLPQGIAQYSFNKNSSQFIFIDYVNQLNLNIVNLQQIENKIIGQLVNNPIIMATNITHFKKMNDSAVIILLETQLILYNLDQMQNIKTITLPLSHLGGNIKVDRLNSRIFVQNKHTGSLVYDFSLTQKTPQPQINTFSNDIQFDENFIYSIVGHSANIFFRKDLQLLMNFRHFNSSFTLKKISYLGIGYFFLVEFISKISIYELSPLQNSPIERAFTLTKQYTLIKQNLHKLGKGELYQLDLQGFTQEGLFTYSISINLFDEQQKACSWSYLNTQDIYQELSTVNQLTSYLSLQSQKLNRLIVTLQQNQNLHLPQISNDQINDSLEIILKGETQGSQVYFLNPLYQYNNLLNLKLKNMKISVDPDLYQTYLKNKSQIQSLDISKQQYPNLKQLIMENIDIFEIKIDIKDVKQVIIKNIQFFDNNSITQSITQLSITSADLVYIDKIIFDKCDFNIQYPLLKFENIAKVEIKSLYISECSFKGTSQVFNFLSIDNLQIDNFSTNLFNIGLQNFLLISQSNVILIKILSLTNIAYIEQTRRLQSLKQQQEIQYTLFDISSSENVNINDLKIDSITSKTTEQLVVFQVKYVKDLLEIKQSKIMNIQTLQNNKATLFMLMGVYDCKFDKSELLNINFMQFINQQSYKISNSNIFLSNSISISNTSIINYTIIRQSIIDGLSQSVYLFNFVLQNIQLNPDDNTNQLVISALQFNTEDMKILNSKFYQISGFYYSTILIKNSISLVIDNSSFSQIISTDLNSFNTVSKKKQSNNQVQENIGTIHFQDCTNIILTKNNFTNNTNSIGSGGSIYSQNCQFDLVDQNIFEYNKSPNGSGGAFYCNVGQFEKFNQNQFSQNSAVLGNGGAILLNNCDIKEFTSNFFIKNEAVVGGAIRYKILKPLAFMNKSLTLIKNQNKFIKNKSICYGQDIGSYPLILDVKNYFEDDRQIQNVTLINVQSGYKAENPIYLRFVDEEMKEVAFINLKSYPKINDDLFDELSLYKLQAESEQIDLLGDLKQEYSYDEFSYKFDLVYSYKPKSSSNIQIKSQQNLYQFVRDQQLAVLKDYEMQINVQFRECKLGEIVAQQGQNTICQICAEGFYSVVDPYSSEEVNCLRCPIGSTECSGFEIKVESGYWRLNDKSDIIEYCFNSPDLCQPQDKNSKSGCIQGYKGPLCEECDVNGEIWGRHYAKFGDFDCRDCGEFSFSLNIFIIFLIFLFIFSQVFMNVYNKLILTRKYILATYLVQMGMISPNIQRTQTVQTSLMKILLNYVQFLMIVSSLEISLPTYFTFFNLSGGDTSKHTLNRLDCILFLLDTNMPNYVVRIIQINLQPLFLFFFIELFIQLVVRSSKTQAQRETLYTNLIIIFCFYQPSITKVLSQAFSCRKIGDQAYIVSDLTKQCLDEEHMFYFFRVLLPLTLFWVILCPLFLFIRMKKYKSKMHEISIMYRYGYLYQEYKHEHYYWDLIRIIVRSFAIITINVFNFRVAFKGLVIQGIIIFYLALAMRFKPYGMQIFNNLDKESCFLVILTLYLIIVGYLSENVVVGMGTTALVAVLNGRFVLMMIQRIFIKPVPFVESKRNLFQNVLFALKRRVPYLFKWIQVSEINKIQTFKYWKMIRRQIFKIIEQSYMQKSSRSYYNPGLSHFATARSQ